MGIWIHDQHASSSPPLRSIRQDPAGPPDVQNVGASCSLLGGLTWLHAPSQMGTKERHAIHRLRGVTDSQESLSHFGGANINRLFVAFTKKLAKRSEGLRKAIVTHGSVIWPLVAGQEDMQLIDGHCRYITPRSLSVPNTYAYVGVR